MKIFIFNRPGYEKECTEVDSLGDIAQLLAEGFSIRYPTEDDIFYDIVETLRGTCNSLSDEDENWLSENDRYQDFNSEIFLCAECGWWMGAGEYADSDCNDMSDGDICSECGVACEEE